MVGSPPIPEDEDTRLRTVRAFDILDTAPEDSFDDLTRLASAICEVPISTVTIVDRERQWFKSMVGLDKREDTREVSFCAHTVVDKKPLVVRDARDDPRFASNPLVLGDPFIRFYAGSPLVTESGQVVGTICVIDRVPRELTESQAQALDALARQTMRLLESRKQARDLQELDRVKDEFVALVSHELRTPLASIRGYLEVLLEEEPGPVNDVQRRFLEIVDRNSVRLHRIVDDLLTLAGLQAGKLPLARGAVDVNDVATEVVETFAPAAAEKKIQVLPDLHATQPVDADRSRLAQVLNNLTSNALKFTPEGGSVVIRTGNDDGEVVVEVCDTGIGIAESDLPHVFGRFFRTAAAEERAIPGTGLGLAISRAIVEAHEGRLDIAETSSGGTTFRMRLPKAAE